MDHCPLLFFGAHEKWSVHWCTANVSQLQRIPWATASTTMSSSGNIWPLRAFFNRPMMWTSHGSKSGLNAGCLSTSYCKPNSWSWNLVATWRQALTFSRIMLSMCLLTCLFFIFICSFWSTWQYHLQLVLYDLKFRSRGSHSAVNITSLAYACDLNFYG